jgi:hypothetical protein
MPLNTFKIALKRLFNKEKISPQGLHSHELTNLIQSALTELKRAKTNLKQIAFRLMLGLMRNEKQQGKL